MKLLTHNFLSSQFLKGVKIGYPLTLAVTKVERKDVEYNGEFTRRIVPKLDYDALVSAAKVVDNNCELPTELAADWETNEDFLKKLHEILLGYEVIDGELQCPESGRKFMIREGIPNMLVNAEEIE